VINGTARRCSRAVRNWPTGEVLDLPAWEPLRTYEVTIADGIVYVDIRNRG
jgi:nitrite reductase/ring-hydroxylating ferredoxin subunit